MFAGAEFNAAGGGPENKTGAVDKFICGCIVGGVCVGSIAKYDDISGRYVGGLNWGSSFAGDRNGIGIHGGVDAD